MEKIGFKWEITTAQDIWGVMFAELIAFKNEHGHCNVPRRYSGNPRLAKWVNTQRTNRKQARLDLVRIRKLDDVGFIWDSLAWSWETMFAELKKYKEQFDDCDVPQQWLANPRLGSWVTTQRAAWREVQEGKRQPRQVTLDHFSRLEGIGFNFTTAGGSWRDNLQRLREYKAQHGDCNVPSNGPDDTLGSWVSNQRSDRKQGTLDEDQIAQLDELGFVWDFHEQAWLDMCSALTCYKAECGDCNVPSNGPESKSVASWVSTQRTLRKSGKLSEARILLLDEVGFIWSLHDWKWDRSFSELSAFKDAHGDCDVAMNWPENPRLASWVSTQRSAKHTGKLSEDRIEQLSEIGFLWKKTAGRPNK